MRRLQPANLLYSDAIIAVNTGLSAQLADILGQIENEGIVVIDYENQGFTLTYPLPSRERKQKWKGRRNFETILPSREMKWTRKQERNWCSEH